MRAIGIILAGGNNNRMRELSDKRAIAAMPIAGSYRSIDFALSNMANSRIQKVAVLTQYNARSLNEHLSSSKWWDFGRKQGGLFVFTPTITKENGFWYQGTADAIYQNLNFLNEHLSSSKWWDFGRKQGGLFVFTPTITKENGFWYQGTADAIYQNLNFLKNSHEPYVVIASGDCVYKMDYNKVLEYHIAKRADITVVCTTCPDPSEVERFGVLRMNEDCRIEEFEEKPMVSPYNTISTGIYVIRRRQLIELIEKAAQEGRNDFVKDILIRYKNLKRIYGYKIDSYWSNISTVESYYKTNMDFLKPEIRNYFFKQEPAVKTKIDDLPPAKYNPGADVRNSLISSGCIVNGVVENSVLFKDVYVGNNCVIKNSVILNDVYLGDNTHIENCIVESRGTIRANSYYSGDGEVEIVVEKNDRYSL